MKRSKHILPQKIESEDAEFVRACRRRLAKQLQIVAEDLLAGMSPESLAGIRVAREDYRQARILSLFPKGLMQKTLSSFVLAANFWRNT